MQTVPGSSAPTSPLSPGGSGGLPSDSLANGWPWREHAGWQVIQIDACIVLYWYKPSSNLLPQHLQEVACNSTPYTEQRLCQPQALFSSFDRSSKNPAMRLCSTRVRMWESKSIQKPCPLASPSVWSLMINPAAQRCASEVVTCICRAATRSLASETFWLSSVFEVSDAVAVALASLPKGGNGEKIEERMVLACCSWTCKGKMSGGGWWRDCFTSIQYTYIYIYYISYIYISISLKGCFPMLSRSDPPHAARLKQRQARDGTKIVNTEGAKRQDVRSCAKSCNSSVREACDASASWSLASIVDFASWPQFPQDQSLPAKPCKAMQSLQGLCTPCIRFPSKDFEYMHGIFNTSHSHESCSPCSFPSALGASTSLLDVWHELKASSKVLSLELCWNLCKICFPVPNWSASNYI